MVKQELNFISSDENLLPLMEGFYSIQGEGFFAGMPAYFIRLAGCDVGCVWCDVKESWDRNQHSLVSVDWIVEQVKTSKCPNVVITGGEPLMYNLDYLTQRLKQQGIKTHLETSGTATLSGIWDWICLSPKKFKNPISEIYAHTNELKVIVFNQSDFEFGEQQACKVLQPCKLFLQPEWSKREVMLPMIVEYVKKNTQWFVSLQTHKYMNIP